MKNTFKKLISILIAACVLASACLSLVSFAEEGSEKVYRKIPTWQ